MGVMAAPGARGMPHHGNRHGRSQEARLAVLAAADDLLVALGFAGVTVEGIAARAGVAKQTIYRWWPSKTDILFEALIVDAAEFFTTPGHGQLGPDLRDRLGQLAAFLGGTDAGAVARALAGQAQHDPAVAARFGAEFVAPQRDRDREPFRRAAARGELPAATDIDLAIDQLAGPVYYRILVTRQDVPPAFTDALVDRYLAQAPHAPGGPHGPPG
ncbi:MAG TPA: TetR/AcrR family transcriptional regulator [Streptosporangiaceae bacterium]|jgi:AcrR family transcriptional regulator